MLPTLFNVVSNTEQVVEPESSPQLGVTMLDNIVDNIEQYGQHNIVASLLRNGTTVLSVAKIYNMHD